MLSEYTVLKVRKVSYLLFIYILHCSAIYSCVQSNINKQPRTGVPYNAASNDGATIPSDWPYKWLVPPSGAVKATLPFPHSKMVSGNQSEFNIARGSVNNNGNFIMMSFSWSGQLSDLLDHMSASLDEHEFFRIENVPPSRIAGSSIIGYSEFRDKNSSYVIRIAYEKADSNMFHPAYEIFYFEVYVYK